MSRRRRVDEDIGNFYKIILGVVLVLQNRRVHIVHMYGRGVVPRQGGNCDFFKRVSKKE